MHRRAVDDITFTTPEGSFVGEMGSPQALIRRFLDKNLPAFPSLSAIELSGNLDEEDSVSVVHADDRNSSSMSLSLPESFDVGYVQGRELHHVQRVSAPPVHPSSSSDVPAPRCTQCLLIKHHLEDRVRLLDHAVTDHRRELETARQELTQARRVAGLSEGGLRQELKLLEDRSARLTHLLDDETKRRARCEEQAARCEQAEARAAELTQELTHLRATSATQRTTLESLTTTDAHHKRKEEDLERMNRLLQADKSHLTLSLQSAETRLHEQTRLWEEERSRNLTLETKLTKLGDQLVELQTQGSQSAQVALQREIQRVREEAQRDLDHLRINSRDIQDREIQVLREARQQTDQELHIARRRVSGLEEAAQEMQSRLLNTQQQRAQETSDLRAELKLKSFETLTLGNSLSERNQQLRDVQAQADRLQKEVAAHRTALSRQEVESERARDMLTAELRTASDKLRAYEALEVEVDQTVLRIAANTLTDTTSALTTGVTDIRGIPSHPESRVRQAVFLAQKLLLTERQRDEMQEQLAQLQKDAQEQRQQREAMENKLQLAAQPAVYLVNKLRQEETQRVQLVHQVESLTRELQRWKLGWQRNEREVQQLRERLSLVLRQRGELETIKVMLHHLHYLQEQEENEEEEEEEESLDGDELARKLLPWRPGGDEGEVEFELSSADEPEKSTAAAALGLPQNTFREMIEDHHQHRSQGRGYSGGKRGVQSSGRGGVRRGGPVREDEYDEDGAEFDDDGVGDVRGDDPEIIPLGYTTRSIEA